MVKDERHTVAYKRFETAGTAIKPIEDNRAVSPSVGVVHGQSQSESY